MKKSVIGAVALLSAMVINPAAAKETISVVGSNTVTVLMEVYSEVYNKKNPDVFIEVQGPGSSAGIKAAKNGSADLGMASRGLKSKEKEPTLKAVTIARDGIAVAINKNNSVNNLTKEQISSIYKGDITNWKDVGGKDQPIVVVTRDTASGTRGAFEDIMKLKKKISGKKVSAISQKAQVANGNGAIKTIVASNPFAIGYISLGTVDSSLKAVDVNGIAASVDNVKAGTYEVARPFLILYREGKPTAATSEFVKWMTSAEAQNIVTKKGYISVL